MKKSRCYTCGRDYYELQQSKIWPGKWVCGGCGSHEPLKKAEHEILQLKADLKTAMDHNCQLVAEMEKMKKERAKDMADSYEAGRAHQAKLEVQGRGRFLSEINDRLSKKTRSRDGDMVREPVTQDDVLAVLKYDNEMTRAGLKA